MDYKGYKLIDSIILVIKEARMNEPYPQAYLVDPANINQLKTALTWAKYTEYGPTKKDSDGQWRSEYTIEHEPKELLLDNSGFKLELLDCAGGSSQGGKLSFWNCLVSKKNYKVQIGINSEMLLDLLKSATFINGVCQEELVFITNRGKVGMAVVGSETYQQCLKDNEIKNTLKTAVTNKYDFGSKICTATRKEIYLGKVYKYYSFEDRRDYWKTQSSDLHKCTLVKLAKPIEYHLIEYLYDNFEKVSDVLNRYETNDYANPILATKRPKRVVTGSLGLDLSEAEFHKRLLDSKNTYSAYKEHIEKGYSPTLFLNKSLFGLSPESFELEPELLADVQSRGIKYVDETVNNK